MDYAALLAELQARGFDYLSATRQGYFVNRSYQELCDEEDWPFLTTTTSGTAPLAVANLRTIETVVDTTNQLRLRPLDRRHILESDYQLSTTGTPEVYYTTPVAGEVQTIVISATGGTFTMTFEGETTSATAYNASTSTVQTNLIALANLESGDVTVSGSTSNYTITFGGDYLNADVPLITTNAGSLTGGSQTATVTGTTGGLYVNVYPANTTNTISVRYWMSPPDLSATVDTPLIPARFHQTIIDGAAAYAYYDSDNFEAGAAHFDLWNQGKARMRDSLLVRQHDRPDDYIVVASGSEDW